MTLIVLKLINETSFSTRMNSYFNIIDKKFGHIHFSIDKVKTSFYPECHQLMDSLFYLPLYIVKLIALTLIYYTGSKLMLYYAIRCFTI